MKSKIAFGAVLLCSTFLMGCGDDEEFFVDQLPQTLLRGVNAAALTGNVDVFVNGNIIAANVPYRSATQFFTPTVGNANVVITRAGNPNQVLFTANPGLALNENYTAVLLSSADGNSATGVFVVDDDSQPSIQGAELHLINGFQQAGNVDVYVFPVGSARPATPTVANLAFGNVANPFQIAGGNFQVLVTAAGNVNNVLLSQDSTSFQTGQDLILVVEPSEPNDFGAAEILGITEQSTTFVIDSDQLMQSM